MSDTLTQIANQALIYINKSPVNNLDEIPENTNASTPSQKSAAIINVVINQTIKWVQAKARWSDLLTKETLSQLSAPSDTSNAYTYTLPTSVVGVPKLVSGAPYEIQGKTLVTQDPSAELWYIRYSLEPSEWNAFLTEAVITELAARIAPKLNVSASEAKEVRAQADRSLIDNNCSDYTFRASPRQKDGWYALNQAREGIGGRYAGSGRLTSLRGEMVPRYPQTST